MPSYIIAPTAPTKFKVPSKPNKCCYCGLSLPSDSRDRGQYWFNRRWRDGGCALMGPDNVLDVCNSRKCTEATAQIVNWYLEGKLGTDLTLRSVFKTMLSKASK